jgi:hypothetical protein
LELIELTYADLIIEVEEKFDQKYNHGLPPLLKGNHDYVSSIAKVILFEGMFKRSLSSDDAYKVLYSINEKSILKDYIFPFDSSKVESSIQSKSLARMYDFYIDERKDEDSPLTALAKVGIRMKNQTLTGKLTEFKTDFIKKEVDGNWQEIPCLVSDNLTDDEKEEIRLTAHLVPQRAWPAYERASHLYDLRHNKLNDFQQIINKMGGNQSSIERSMMAFQDMRDYYINKVDVVDPYRYSSFDELQKSNLKTVIMDKGFSLDDFGQWVINDNFGRNENVRLLKKVLNNEKATEIFLNKGVKSIERAEKYLNSLEIEPPELSSASIIQLAKTLSNKISNLASLQIEEIKSKDNDTFWELQNLHQTIDEIFIKKDGE